MNNILFSDYDGTIKGYEKNPNIFEKMIFKRNIKSINNFCSHNTFVLTTGRTTESILKEVNKYNIHYDYITSFDGRVTLDSNKRIVYEKILEKTILDKIRNILLKHKYKDIYMFNNFGSTSILDNIVVLKIVVYNIDILKYIKDILSKYRFIDVEYDKIFKVITISYTMNKSMAIKELLNKERLENNNIITIGDNLNDLEMLVDYNGYKVLLSHPFLYCKGIKTTTTVSKLIKKIEGEG